MHSGEKSEYHILKLYFKKWNKYSIVGVTLLRSSLNLTVAALWKTTLTSSSSNLTDCGDGEVVDGGDDDEEEEKDEKDPLEVLLCDDDPTIN